MLRAPSTPDPCHVSDAARRAIDNWLYLNIFRKFFHHVEHPLLELSLFKTHLFFNVIHMDVPTFDLFRRNRVLITSSTSFLKFF